MRRTKKNIVPFQFYESKSSNGTERNYVRLTNSQGNSDAILDLSANAFRIFVYMKFRAKGKCEFFYTYENGTTDASISRQTYKNVVDELERVGLIERLPTNMYSASKYKFSDKWKNYKSPRRDMLTGKRKAKNWKNPRPQPKKVLEKGEVNSSI